MLPRLKKNKVYIFLILVLIISAILRFYRLENIFVFNFDEEYQMSYSWTLVKDFHLIWIGVSASFLDFYLGPYFTYLTTLLLAVSKGDPLIGAYFAASLGILTTGLVFFIGWKIFNLTTGIISSLLYATLPLIVFFDQKYWNATFTPLITFLLFFTVYKARKSKWWWLFFAALAGAIFETHLEPLPLLLAGMWFFIKGKYFKDIKLFIACLFVFLIFYWPLIVFDINHNFSNISSLTRIGKSFGESKIAFNPSVKMQSLFDSLGRFWYLQPGNPVADEINFSCNPLTVKSEFKNVNLHSKRTTALFFFSVLSVILILGFLIFSFKSKSFQIQLLGIFLTVALIAFTFYPGASSEYYTLSILYLLLFVPGILINEMRFRYKILILFSLIIVCIPGIYTVLNTSDEFSLKPKKELIKKVMNVVGKNSFEIDGRGICHNYEGWRYLFKVYGKMPSQSYTDKNLGWLYSDEIVSKAADYTVILSEDRIPLSEDLSKYPNIKEGGYSVYIREN